MSIKEVKRQAQIKRRQKIHQQFQAFQIDNFGRLLEVGDVLDMPIGKVTNSFLSEEGRRGDKRLEMLVVEIGQNLESKTSAVGLIYKRCNRLDQDPHNNYCLAYGKSGLTGAKIIGKEDVIVMRGLNNQIGYSKIEPLQF